MIQWENIPQELRALAQWVAADSDKHPFSPITGEAASVTDPSTWGSFEDAMAAGLAHVGFVLTKEDPYCVVDLDDPTTRKVNGVTELEPDLERVATIKSRHQEIFEDFDTYAEFSQSGTGVHIVCRGSVPQGVRRNKVEVYSDSRYMIFTGNVLKALPITEQQFFVTDLYNTISQDSLPAVELQQVASTLSDEELFNMASTAANSEKFTRLWNGNWQGVAEWPSQSEADFALLAMLGFYSPDNAQVRRMFRWSALGQREKARKNDRYLNYALSKIRAKTPPPVDFSTLLARGSALVPSVATQAREEAAQQTQAPKGKPPLSKKASKSERDDNYFPPGLVGDVARYIYASSMKQVREISLVAAIGLIAGVSGRAYSISNTGLNVYLLLLAETGRGKEDIKKGIGRIFSAAEKRVPMIREYDGPGAFASGQALVRVLDRKPCFVSILREFAETLKRICRSDANSSDAFLKGTLLDLYGKSGPGQTLNETAYSDPDKTTKPVTAPCVTIIGESNPDSLYDGLSLTQLKDGLISRFTIIDYEGEAKRDNPNQGFPPPDDLLRSFEALVATSMAASQNKECKAVERDEAALKIFEQYSESARSRLNDPQETTTSKEVWNRANLKALKLAGLVAVGVNPYKPVVTREIAEWAIDYTTKEVSHIEKKFKRNEVGTGDLRLESHIIRIVTGFLDKPEALRISQYGCSDKMARYELVPYSVLNRFTCQIADFRNDKRDHNRALSETLNAMCKADKLQLVPPPEAFKTFGARAPVYSKGSEWGK